MREQTPPALALGVRTARLLAARTRRIAAVDEVATGLGDTSQELSAIPKLENDWFEGFPLLLHADTSFLFITKNSGEKLNIVNFLSPNLGQS